MKKEKYILIFIIILINSIYLTHVKAEELNINIKEIKQGDTVLVKEGDTYIASNFEAMYATIEISPYNEETDNYYLYIHTGWNGSGQSYYKNSLYTLPNQSSELAEYIVDVCDNYECNEKYATTTFKVKLSRYNEIENSIFNITSIKQNGVEIEEHTEGDYVFIFNNKQDIEITIKGENLIDDASYTINNGYYEERKNYLGSELEQGITYTYSPKNKDYFGFSIYLGNFYQRWFYHNVENYINGSNTTFIDDETIGDYQTKLFYTDYKNKSIEKLNSYNTQEIYILNKKYYNQNHTLSYKITGSNYQDKIYTVDIDVLDNRNNIYHKTIEVNGNNLNNGYNIELDKLLLESEKKYTFITKIDGITEMKTIAYAIKNMTITSVKQENKELKLEDDTYIADDISSVILSINIEGYDVDNDNYYVKVQNESASYGTPYVENNPIYLDNYFKNEIEEYTIMICDEYECNKVYAIDSIKVKYTLYNQISKSKIVISNIMQDGKQIEMDENGNFQLNNKQNITFFIKGENLIKDAKYIISTGNQESKEYLGSELEKGFTYIHYTGAGNDYFNISYRINHTHFYNYYYFDGNEYHQNGEEEYINYILNPNQEISDYDAELFYTNYSDKKIEYDYVYTLNSNFFNKDNTMSLLLNGMNFQNRDYTVTVEVTPEFKSEKDKVFEMTKEVNGELLNNEYHLELENFLLELNKNKDLGYTPWYELKITINDITKKYNLKYTSLDKQTYISSNMFLNGKKTSNVAGGEYGIIFQAPIGLLEQTTKPVLKYIGENFKEEDNYEYEIEYGYYDKETFKKTYTQILKTETITGEVLNHIGISHEVTNPSNYQNIVYRLSIKKGEEIINVIINLIELDNENKILFETLTTNSHKLYYQGNEGEFLIQQNTPINIELSGLNFENKTYKLNVCHSFSKQGVYTNNCKKVELNGNDINEGKVSIPLDEKFSDDEEYHSIEIHDASYDVVAFFQLSLIDLNNIITEKDRYVVDNTLDIIKNIHKNTSPDELLNKLKITDDGMIKVYNQSEEEITNKIGTGHLGKILNKYQQNIYDVHLVVNGDVNGDGDITVTDLVKVKKHLTNKTKLEDLYKDAADITKTGDISITDLVKMAQDVTEIKEIE